MNLLLDIGRVYGLGYEANSNHTIHTMVMQCVASWAQHDSQWTKFKGITWFTDTDSSWLMNALDGKLKLPELPLGLNILQYRGSEHNSEPQFGRSLIDALLQVCAFSTNLIIIERPERWLSDLDHLHFQAMPLNEIRRIRRWCLARQTTILFLTPHGPANLQPYWENLIDGFGILHTTSLDVKYKYWLHQGAPLGSTEYLKQSSDANLAVTQDEFIKAVAKVCPKLTGLYPAHQWVHLNRLAEQLLSVVNAKLLIARLPLLDHIIAKDVQDNYISEPYGSTLTIVSDSAYVAIFMSIAKNQNQIQAMLQERFNRPIYELFSGEMYSQADHVETTFTRVWNDYLLTKTQQTAEQIVPIQRNVVETVMSHKINDWGQALQYWYSRWRKNAVKNQAATLLIRKENE